MSDILLSIVIPTKSRYEYLKILVSVLLKFDYQNFEVIIQDNTPKNTEILNFLDSASDRRIVYNHNANWMSMKENCDNGIAITRGKYVIMLGDDDGVVESIFELAEWMEKNNVDAAITNKPIYLWPGIRTRVLSDVASGSLLLKKTSGQIKKIDPLLELDLVLRLGASDMKSLPRVYHGLVSKNCLEQLKEETGSYFPGPSPDMANAVGLTKYVKTFYLIDKLIIITGNAPKSAGGQGLRHDHIGRIEDQKSLPVGTAENWSPFIPKFWSGQTIWAEAVHKALIATQRADLLAKFNYSYLYACCLVFQKNFNEFTFETIHNYRNKTNKSFLCFNFRILLTVLVIYYLRLLSLFRNLLFRFSLSSKIIKGLNTIEHCINYIERNFDTRSYGKLYDK